MAQRTVAALSLALFTQTAEYVKGLKTADTSTKAFAKGAKDAGKSVGDAFQKIADGVPQVNPLLGKLVNVVQAGVSAFKAMGLAAKGASAAFIATGIGAVVVALGTAFAALSSWISRTTEGADKAKTVWAGVTAVFEEILDRVSILGSAIAKFVTGDFRGAASEIKRFWESVKQFGDDVQNSIAGSVSLQERENQLRKDKIAFITREAEILEKISELRRKAQESEGFTALQQQGFIKQAIELQKQLGNERRRLAQEEANIQSERVKLADSNYADLEKEAQLKRAVFDITVAENNGLRELLEKQKSLTALVEREASARQKSLGSISEIAPVTIASSITAPELPGLPGLDLGVPALTAELGGLNDELSTTGNLAASAFQQLGEGFESAAEGGESFKKSLKGVIKGLISQGITAAISKTLLSAGLFGPVALALAGVAGKGASALFGALVPSFATGGIMPYTGTALVGERGPELVSLPRGSRIYNNSDTQRMLGGTQRVEVVGESVLRGSDIYISFKEEARKRGNISGG